MSPHQDQNRIPLDTWEQDGRGDGDPLTFFVFGVQDEAAAQGAGRVDGPVLGHGAEAGLAEHVAAWLTAVRAEEDLQAHGAGETFGVSVLLLFLLENTQTQTLLVSSLFY